MRHRRSPLTNPFSARLKKPLPKTSRLLQPLTTTISCYGNVADKCNLLEPARKRPGKHGFKIRENRPTPTRVVRYLVNTFRHRTFPPSNPNTLNQSRWQTRTTPIFSKVEKHYAGPYSHKKSSRLRLDYGINKSVNSSTTRILRSRQNNKFNVDQSGRHLFNDLKISLRHSSPTTALLPKQ